MEQAEAVCSSTAPSKAAKAASRHGATTRHTDLHFGSMAETPYEYLQGEDREHGCGLVYVSRFSKAESLASAGTCTGRCVCVCVFPELLDPPGLERQATVQECLL